MKMRETSLPEVITTQPSGQVDEENQATESPEIWNKRGEFTLFGHDFDEHCVCCPNHYPCTLCCNITYCICKYRLHSQIKAEV